MNQSIDYVSKIMKLKIMTLFLEHKHGVKHNFNIEDKLSITKGGKFHTHIFI